jgi:SAM-dependent methyltransferase
MKRVVMWGTGGNAEAALQQLPSLYIEIVAFIDSDPLRQGILFHNKVVMHPQELLTLDFNILAIASNYHKEIKKTALSYGINESKIFLASNLIHFLQFHEKLSLEKLIDLARIQWWFHGFEIVPGVWTPGAHPYKGNLLDFPEVKDLRGKRALDIGAWDGPYTLEMTRRGAEVTGFDIQRSDRTGFDLMRSLNRINAKHICANVYDLNPEDHGTFDLVTFFGVYYHLRNPLAAFANINGVLPKGGLMIVEGALLEGSPRIDSFWKENKHILDHLANVPLAYFVEHEYEGEWSNWWVPNACCFQQWITSCGFEILSFRIWYNDTRSLCIARKVRDMGIEHCIQ